MDKMGQQHTFYSFLRIFWTFDGPVIKFDGPLGIMDGPKNPLVSMLEQNKYQIWITDSSLKKQVRPIPEIFLSEQHLVT